VRYKLFRSDPIRSQCKIESDRNLRSDLRLGSDRLPILAGRNSHLHPPYMPLEFMLKCPVGARCNSPLYAMSAPLQFLHHTKSPPHAPFTTGCRVRICCQFMPLCPLYNSHPHAGLASIAISAPQAALAPVGARWNSYPDAMLTSVEIHARIACWHLLQSPRWRPVGAPLQFPPACCVGAYWNSQPDVFFSARWNSCPQNRAQGTLMPEL